MEDRSDIIPYLAVWVPLMGLLLWHLWNARRPTAGLVFGYFFQMWMYFWLGGLAHGVPWSDLPNSDLTFLGLQQATWALASFLMGVWIARRLVRSAGPRAARIFEPDPRLPRAYLVAGLVFYFALIPLFAGVPTLNALVGVGQYLLLVGFSLSCWQAWIRGRRREIFRWLALLLLLPLATLTRGGFLGYGVLAASVVVIFVSRFFRPRWLVMAGALAVGYGGLTFYVAYMRNRGNIRDAAWGGESTTVRLEKIAETFDLLEPFDLRDPAHLHIVDLRINQAGLCGAAVRHLSTTRDFVWGETVWQAILGLIPRAIWPDKPIFAGSMGFASRFTGLTFADGTSVGIGQVMEMYGNFGEAGVWIGFVVIGMAIGTLDLKAGERLSLGDWQGFSKYFLTGIACLNVIGSLFEITTSAAACLVLIHIVNTLLERFQRVRQRWRPEPSLPHSVIR